MKILYTPRHNIRQYNQYEWNAENGYVRDVTEPEAINVLLGHFGFEVDNSDPFIRYLDDVGSARAAKLARAGLYSLQDVAALSESTIANVAEVVGVAPQLLSTWQRQARQHVEAESATAQRQQEQEQETQRQRRRRAREVAAEQPGAVIVTLPDEQEHGGAEPPFPSSADNAPVEGV